MAFIVLTLLALARSLSPASVHSFFYYFPLASVFNNSYKLWVMYMCINKNVKNNIEFCGGKGDRERASVWERERWWENKTHWIHHEKYFSFNHFGEQRKRMTFETCWEIIFVHTHGEKTKQNKTQQKKRRSGNRHLHQYTIRVRYSICSGWRRGRNRDKIMQSKKQRIMENFLRLFPYCVLCVYIHYWILPFLASAGAARKLTSQFDTSNPSRLQHTNRKQK